MKFELRPECIEAVQFLGFSESDNAKLWSDTPDWFMEILPWVDEYKIPTGTFVVKSYAGSKVVPRLISPEGFYHRYRPATELPAE